MRLIADFKNRQQKPCDIKGNSRNVQIEVPFLSVLGKQIGQMLHERFDESFLVDVYGSLRLPCFIVDSCFVTDRAAGVSTFRIDFHVQVDRVDETRIDCCGSCQRIMQ